jgi:hypothetical protein
MPKPGLHKILYRILSWSTLAVLVITLALVLRKSPPPDVPYDPNAAARVEQKFAAADRRKPRASPRKCNSTAPN